MHEFSITSEIVKTVLEEANKRDAKKVLEVHLIIGKLTLLGIDQIRFSYKSLIKDTIISGSKLFVRRMNGKVECGQCGYKGPINCVNDPVYHFSFPTLVCPKCSSSVKIIAGRECIVKRIKLEI